MNNQDENKKAVEEISTDQKKYDQIEKKNIKLEKDIKNLKSNLKQGK